MKNSSLLKSLVLCGTVFVVVGVAAAASKDKDKKNEVKLSTLPAAVQKTIAEQTKGSEIIKVVPKVDAGHTNFNVHTIKGGVKAKITISSDGKLKSDDKAAAKTAKAANPAAAASDKK